MYPAEKFTHLAARKDIFWILDNDQYPMSAPGVGYLHPELYKEVFLVEYGKVSTAHSSHLSLVPFPFFVEHRARQKEALVFLVLRKI